MNFEIPMRVETASCSRRMTRRSIARATRLVITTKAVTTTSPFSSAHRLNCDLPGIRLIWLRVLSIRSSQPTRESAIASHNTKVSRVSQVRIQEPGPIISASR